MPSASPLSLPRRPAPVDVVIVIGLLAGPFMVSLFAPAGAPFHGPQPLSAGLSLAAIVCLLWRQVAPLPVMAVVSLIVVGNAAAGYPVSVVQWPVWIALFTCFSWHRWPARTVTLALALLGVAGYLLFNRGPVGGSELSAISVSILVATVTGDAARSRRVSAAAVSARLASEERERAILAEQAVQQERARWARELHDAVGHAVNVMVMQAGVGRRVFAENPEFAKEALGHVEDVGREALGELDRLLRESGDENDATVPSTLDLSDLPTRVGAAGRDLILRVDPVRLAPSVSRALYRIVQEAVTNALRHSASGPIWVEVSTAGASVMADVRNPLPDNAAMTPSTRGGRGLINMRERARLEGGDLEAGPANGEFRVRVRLPAQDLSTPDQPAQEGSVQDLPTQDGSIDAPTPDGSTTAGRAAMA